MIPPNARVIEWTTDITRVAVRNLPGGGWQVSGYAGGKMDSQLISPLALTAENLVVLATFPEPTLAEIVGDAKAFTYLRHGSGEVGDLRFAALINGRWNVFLTGSGLTPSTFGSLGEMESRYRAIGSIDLSTVTPLVPRGES